MQAMMVEAMSVAKEPGTATELTTNFERTNPIESEILWVKSRYESLIHMKLSTEYRELVKPERNVYRNNWATFRFKKGEVYNETVYFNVNNEICEAITPNGVQYKDYLSVLNL